MHSTDEHRTTVELEQSLPEVLASPSDAGKLVAIFVRPATNERRALEVAELSPERGIEGDRWVVDSFYRLADRSSDPRCQVSVMNARYLRQIAGQEDAMCLAGDNLIVDLDLSEANIPAGSRVAIGPEVVLEFSDLAHTGCSKFAARYGHEARAFTNSPRGKQLNLRGRYARIVRGGTVRAGDDVLKLVPGD
jgi:hypothetical protein